MIHNIFNFEIVLWVLSFIGILGLGILWWLSRQSQREEQLRQAEALLTHNRKKEEEMAEQTDRTHREHQENFHCGWAYLDVEFHDKPPIDPGVLQKMRTGGGGRKPNGVFFIVLQGNKLFLYDSEDKVKMED